ncbi:MAG TPA: squalene synthase HpnC [Bryobacteraceae bacterium]|nr:squalene synthase HpnC [Bryobacteraceae bacterium]
MLAPKDFVADREAMARNWPTAESLAYTRWMATGHYENFHVVSFLLPKELHQDFYNVYSFCRWADDLGDEIGDTRESLRLLAWWRGELERMYRGEASHPVFVALGPTVRKRNLPIEPFANLITAFEHDQTVTRYANWEEVFAYCVNSANPVGRLVLGLGGYADAERYALSDATCTGLQLANFWQDVSVDLAKDRVYLPLDLLARHGVTVDAVYARRFTPEFANAMREACGVAREFFQKGLALPPLLDRRLALDVTLFSRGGLCILDKIEQNGFDVLTARPYITKGERVRLLLKTLIQFALRRAA